jgi:hypothetical protein
MGWRLAGFGSRIGLAFGFFLPHVTYVNLIRII